MLKNKRFSAYSLVSACVAAATIVANIVCVFFLDDRIVTNFGLFGTVNRVGSVAFVLMMSAMTAASAAMSFVGEKARKWTVITSVLALLGIAITVYNLI